MKRERKYSKGISKRLTLFLLFAGCLCFTSCITINRMQEPQAHNPSIDPVCGMKVDTSTALKTDYNGRTYYFDTEECQKVFLKNPEKFASGQMADHNNHNNMSHMGWAGGAIMVTAMAIAMTTMIFFGHWR